MKLISQADAAEYLGCSVKTIRRRISDGTLTAYRVGKTHTIRLDKDEVDAILRPIPTAGVGR